MYDMRARMYDPTLGRFTGTDPYPAGAAVPAVEAYDYAGEDPIDGYDLSGLSFCKPWQWKCISTVGANYIVPAAAVAGGVVAAGACAATVVCGVGAATAAVVGAAVAGTAATVAVDLHRHASIAHTVVDAVQAAASEGLDETGEQAAEAQAKAAHGEHEQATNGRYRRRRR
jgi:hypothetical protein